jgi:hypothetical protein
VITGVVDGLLGGLLGEPPRRRESVDATGKFDRLFERILAGGRDGERALEALIATGIRPGEVERLLADYKRRRSL